MGDPTAITTEQRLRAVPPGAERPVSAGNLPVRLNSFVGRETELGEVDRWLAQTRLLTLTGAGGCGKSRLAAEAAGRMTERFPDGLWWVELASLGDPDLLPATVAAALSMKESMGTDLTGAIRDRLVDKSLLVLLDNCEHLVDHCGEFVETLLRGCPEVVFVATSREALGAEGEVALRVPSLRLPAEGEATADCESVRLFVDRARQAHTDFQATPAVGEVCRRLDGMPLAIELAAARSRVLSPEEILAGLTDRFGLLTGGRRTALPRQRTLQASVDWSYDLLAADERTLLHRLSVFAGSFSCRRHAPCARLMRSVARMCSSS